LLSIDLTCQNKITIDAYPRAQDYYRRLPSRHAQSNGQNTFNAFNMLGILAAIPCDLKRLLPSMPLIGTVWSCLFTVIFVSKYV